MCEGLLFLESPIALSAQTRETGTEGADGEVKTRARSRGSRRSSARVWPCGCASSGSIRTPDQRAVIALETMRRVGETQGMVRWLVIGLAVVGASGARAEPPACAALAGAAEVPPGELADWARPIARAITDAEARLDAGAAARVVIIEHPEAGAWFCAEGDVVYVSRALVSWAWLGRAVDGRDFLGFVLAHELAHRRFDRDDGALGDACPEVDYAREARADRRAAFLLAAARDPERGRGFSPFRLDRHEALTSFFRGELGWGRDCPALTARVGAVADAIARMTELQALYAAATDITFAGPDDVALALLGGLERRVAAASGEGAWDAVPELRVARALVHLERAAAVGWCPEAVTHAPLEPSPCTLRCIPTLPRYARLAPRDVMGVRDRRLVDKARELATVRRLLDEAAAQGFERGASIEACVAYLEGDPARALALGSASQRSLFELQRFVLESALPPGSAPWLDALREHREGSPPRGDPFPRPVDSVIRAWLAEPPASRRIESSRVPSLDAWATLARCPTGLQPIPLDDGWSLTHGGGCTVVMRGGGVRLVLREARPTGLAATLEAWAGACELAPRGLGDDDAQVLTARCPAWDGPGERWVVFAGQTLRALRVEEAP